MTMTDATILAINPGSTSTKMALYVAGEERFATTVPHDDAALADFRGRPILDQLELRLEAIRGALAEREVDPRSFDAVVGRGGLLRPLASGTYAVSDVMLDELRAAPRGEHASNLGAFLARRLAEAAGCPALIVDPVSVDEWDDVARLSGLAGLDRVCLSHALNTKAVAKRYAAEVDRPYGELRLVVAHLGSGVSVSAHRDGRMVDVNNPREEGPFSTERAGSLPVMELLASAIGEQWTLAEADRRLFREGGLVSYLGTRDLRDVERRIDIGDDRARLVLEALAYQVRKEAGAMAAVLEGRVDAVLVTGGMAKSDRLARALTDTLGWIAPVRVYPGEDELRALAEGAARAVEGVEEPRAYTVETEERRSPIDER